MNLAILKGRRKMNYWADEMYDHDQHQGQIEARREMDEDNARNRGLYSLCPNCKQSQVYSSAPECKHCGYNGKMPKLATTKGKS